MLKKYEKGNRNLKKLAIIDKKHLQNNEKLYIIPTEVNSE